VVIGDGSERKRLERMAGSNIQFLGKVPFETLRHHMARCRALVFPGDEDFGIIPLEVQASGRPVIAYGRGGVLDTVTDGETGILYTQNSVEGLIAALIRFEADDLSSRCRDACVANAHRFTEQRFQAGIAAALAEHGIATAWKPDLPA
jgi:glycosyltransferase involved in cell wall biosynthesis